MPSTVNLYEMAVWFCVGLATGGGWALGTFIINRLLGLFSHPV